MTKLILYSDSCDGQNRNIKLTLLLKHFLESSQHIQQIEQKYFVSGHSYNRCDGCFSTIEKDKRFAGDIYTPEHWASLIKDAKKTEPKFDVEWMKVENSASSAQLQKNIANRKKDIRGEKINWFEARVIRYLKSDPFSIYLINDSGISQCINIKKKNSLENPFREISLECLFPDGKKISKAKYDDLMDLLKFIPKQHHDFFKKLEFEQNQSDYGLASDVSDE